MKIMKKKILLLLTMSMVMLSMIACGSDAKTSDDNQSESLVDENTVESTIDEEANESIEAESQEIVEEATMDKTVIAEVEYAINGTTFVLPHPYADLEAMGWAFSSDRSSESLAPGEISSACALINENYDNCYIFVYLINRGDNTISLNDAEVLTLSIDCSTQMIEGKPYPTISACGIQNGNLNEQVLAVLGTNYIECSEAFGMYYYTWKIAEGANLKLNVQDEWGGVCYLGIENNVK